MNFFGWLGSLFGRSRLDKGQTADPFIGTSTPSGNTINAETALKLSAVWACVRLRSQVISSLPLHLYDKDKKIANQHPIYRLLHDSPNADMTACEFWEGMIASLDLWGNAYALIIRHKKTNHIIALDILNPEHVRVSRGKDGLITYIYQENGKYIRYTSDEVLHIKGFSLDGLVGLSPIAYQSSVIGLQTDANNAIAHEFKNQFKGGGFLKTGEKGLTDEQRERMRSYLTEFGKPEMQASL